MEFSFACLNPGDGETHSVYTQGNRSVHHTPGEGDAVLCPKAAVAAVW